MDRWPNQDLNLGHFRCRSKYRNHSATEMDSFGIENYFYSFVFACSIFIGFVASFCCNLGFLCMLYFSPTENHWFRESVLVDATINQSVQACADDA